MAPFLQGLAIGFSIAAPVGPIGVLCIQRTLSRGRLTGFVSGLGAATADAAYGLAAGLGLTLATRALVEQQLWLRTAGAIFLCALGVRTCLSRPAEKPAAGRAAGLAGAYLSTLGLTLTNPATILSFAAVFSGTGASIAPGGGGLALVAGVFLGSALWWLILSAAAGALRERLRPGGLRWIHQLSGLALAGFGVGLLLTLRRG